MSAAAIVIRRSIQPGTKPGDWWAWWWTCNHPRCGCGGWPWMGFGSTQQEALNRGLTHARFWSEMYPPPCSHCGGSDHDEWCP